MKKYFLIRNKVYSDRSELDLSDASIVIQNFYFSQKLWWKNWWNYSVADKRIVSELSKVLKLNFNSTNWRFECRLYQNFTFLSLIVSEKWDVKKRDGRVNDTIDFPYDVRRISLARNYCHYSSLLIINQHTCLVMSGCATSTTRSAPNLLKSSMFSHIKLQSISDILSRCFLFFAQFYLFIFYFYYWQIWTVKPLY